MGLNDPGGIKGVKIPICPVVNGGFETGDFTGWQEQLTNHAYTQIVTDPSVGVYAAKLHCHNVHIGQSSYALRQQTIQCSGIGQTLHFDYKVIQYIPFDAGMRLSIYAGTYPHGQSYIISCLPQQTTYTTYSLEWPSELTYSPITIYFSAKIYIGQYINSCDAYVDNIRIV